MAGEVTLDTGPLVAMLDCQDCAHEQCTAALARCRGPLVTTEPVLVEALYLLRRSWANQKRCFEFILHYPVAVAPSSLLRVKRTAELMEKYQDQPMDYADATLVALAEDLDTADVFTLDRRDFTVYRIRGRTPFQIIP